MAFWLSQALAAERPDVRSHAERGNEGKSVVANGIIFALLPVNKDDWFWLQ